MIVLTPTPETEAFFEECSLYPALKSVGHSVYFIREGKIVGSGRIMGSRNDFDMTIEPDAETTASVFANDYAIPLLGSVYNLRYSKYTGEPLPGFSDEPKDRHQNTTVVDKLYFDMGIAGKRFSDVEGYGKEMTKKETA